MRPFRLVFTAIFAWSVFGLAQISSAALIMQMIDSFETPAGGLPFTGPIAAPSVTSSGDGILGTRNFKLSSPLVFGDAAFLGGGSLQVYTGQTAMRTSLSYGFPEQSFSPLAGIAMDFRVLDSGFTSR